MYASMIHDALTEADVGAVLALLRPLRRNDRIRVRLAFVAPPPAA
jgi:hypothetical protein